MKYLKRIFHFLILNLIVLDCKAQCENVVVKTDKFTDAVFKSSVNPLVLENNQFKVVLNIKWNYTYYLIEGNVYDKTAPNYSISLSSNFGNTKIAHHSAVYFLFTDGNKAIYLNNAYSPDIIKNEVGLIEIPLMSLNYRSDYKEYEQKLLGQLMASTVDAIRIGSVNGIDLDFDLRQDQKSFFKTVLECMILTKK